MAGTTAGGKKVNETLLKKFNGDQEALTRWRQEIGRMGGQKSRKGGFAAGDEGRLRASYYGRIGGLKSRKRPKT